MSSFSYGSKTKVGVGGALRDILDLLPHGIVLLDRRQHVVLENACAREILGVEWGLGRDGRTLTCADECRPQPLADLVADILGRSRGAGSLAVVHTAATGAALSIDIRRVSFGAALFVTNIHRRVHLDAVALQRVYELSAAESQLAVELAHGRTLDEIAALFGRDRETLRTQLKGVFAKTRTCRQADLVRALLSSVMTVHSVRPIDSEE